MNTRPEFPLFRTAAPVLVAAAALILASCSSKKPIPMGPVHSYQDEVGGSGYAGQDLVQSSQTNATVVSIDAPARKLVLRFPDGRTTTYRAGPEVANFSRIKVGAKVKAYVTEELAISVVTTAVFAASTNQVAVFRSPTGSEVGPKPVPTMSFTGKILSLDPFERQVTIQLAAGAARIIKVRDGIQLGALNLGDDVSVLVTEAMTITLATP